MTSTALSVDFRYRAFVSSSPKDKKWASWLHKALETCKVPARDGYNYNGDHLMRGTNIEFTIRLKVMPYAP